ncbi:MAG: hypothetical protein RLZZ597_2632 [Cyanobacteriota bacterium]|jgi:hypothetical protein
MFTIELTLKHTAMPLSVQKKEQEAAEALYGSIVNDVRSGNGQWLEMTCDQIPSKKVLVLSSEVAAVQIFEKSGTATASGRPPGFFALTTDQ